MTAFICSACGTQYPDSKRPPEACPICLDERQFVPASGQAWCDMRSLARTHVVVREDEAPSIVSLTIDPHFAIGQRAFLIRGPQGNILWDCLSLVDQPTIDALKALGGIAAIAISHPHYYSAMLAWSEAFGDVPVHLHADDSAWVQVEGPALRFWEGEKMPLLGATLIRCGGHFAGGTVLHCPWIAEGAGALFSGDILQVVPDRRHVSFMYSYPNLIPLDAASVRRIGDAVEPYDFETVYGAFAGRKIAHGGKAAVRASVARYVEAIGGEAP